MGYGAYSGNFTFTPRVVPATPTKAPRDIVTQTNRALLAIEFDEIISSGGSPITQYNVYLDDGLDQDNFTPHAVGTALAKNFTGLVEGRWYRLKYSATNIQGEGPLSPEVNILLA